MRTTIITGAVLVALLIAGCGSGGSNATQPRTSAGVEQMARAFTKEVRAGNGDAACEQYMTVASRALVKAFLGDCGNAMQAITAENGGATGVEKEMVTVTGNHAVWRNPYPDGSNTDFAYGDDHRWRIDLTTDTGGGFE